MRTAQELPEIDSISWDVAVIGAGIAGSVMARELSREGLKVLLIEKKRFPRAKVCGACLNGLALSVLDHLGLTDRSRPAEVDTAERVVSGAGVCCLIRQHDKPTALRAYRDVLRMRCVVEASPPCPRARLADERPSAAAILATGRVVFA